jgi:hypothetical protein
MTFSVFTHEGLCYGKTEVNISLPVVIFYPYWTVRSSLDKRHFENCFHESSVLELTHRHCPFSVSVAYLLLQHGDVHSQFAHNQQTGMYFMMQYQLPRLCSIECDIFTGYNHSLWFVWVLMKNISGMNNTWDLRFTWQWILSLWCDTVYIGTSILEEPQQMEAAGSSEMLVPLQNYEVSHRRGP